jgi:hypothetical protein
VLTTIERDYGMTDRHTLGELIELKTGADAERDVFRVPAG